MKYLQNEEVILQFLMIFQIRLKNNTVEWICPLI
jgi:hypothetical protein